MSTVEGQPFINKFVTKYIKNVHIYYFTNIEQMLSKPILKQMYL